MTHLSEADLEWIDVYYNGESVLFVSNFGNVDTLTVTDKFYYDTRNPFYFSEGSRSISEANMGYNYSVKHLDETLDGLFFIRKKVVVDSLYVTCSFGGRFTKGEDFPVGNDDTIIIDDNKSYYPPAWKERVKNKIIRYVWSKEHGLIYYKFEYGEEFFREDLLPDSVNDITN